MKKYQELYDAMKKQEAQGRDWCRIYAVVLGFLVFVISNLAAWQALAFFTQAAAQDPRELQQALPPAFLLVGLLLGLWTYMKGYAYGKHLMLEAQKTLVLVDTEKNTAETVEILRESKATLTQGS